LGVTVVMTTYNHEPFIARAIESVLMQQCSFPVQLWVGEDCSTDGTRKVVEHYVRSEPERVRALLHEKNVGATRNLAQLIARCESRYIALLEGDDYWTCPHKLQKQVEFLEANRRCVLCFHATGVIYEDGSFPPCVRAFDARRAITTIKDLLRGNYIQTCTVVLRTGVIGRIPDWYYGLLIDDWTLFVLNAQFGDVGYIDEVMSVYRVHIGGVWSRLNRADQQLCRLRAYDAVNAHLNRRYDGIVRGVTAKCCHVLAVAREKQGDLAAAAAFARESLARRCHGPFREQAHLFRVLLRFYAPRLYNGVRAVVRQTVKRRERGASLRGKV
jgi:glycosyltransferase involved in cell wall biosynthesis